MDRYSVKLSQNIIIKVKNSMELEKKNPGKTFNEICIVVYYFVCGGCFVQLYLQQEKLTWPKFST